MIKVLQEKSIPFGEKEKGSPRSAWKRESRVTEGRRAGKYTQVTKQNLLLEKVKLLMDAFSFHFTNKTMSRSILSDANFVISWAANLFSVRLILRKKAAKAPKTNINQNPLFSLENFFRKS